MNLPICIWQYIMKFLNISSTIRLRQVCSIFYRKLKIYRLPLLKINTPEIFKYYPDITYLSTTSFAGSRANGIGGKTDSTIRKLACSKTNEYEFPESIETLKIKVLFHIPSFNLQNLTKLKLCIIDWYKDRHNMFKLPVSLTYLNISWPYFQDNHLNHLTNLKTLKCKGARITTIPSSVTNLYVFNCKYLSDINYLTNLEKLSYSWMKIDKFPINLTYLNMEGNSTVENISYLVNLKTLKCGHTEVVKIPTSITHLYFSGPHLINNDHIKTLTNLTKLDIYHKSTITKFPKTLTYLSIPKINNITDLRHLTNLKTLKCNYFAISTGSTEFKKNIEYLACNNNGKIHDRHIKDFINLRKLECSNTNITYFPNTLIYLDIRDNPLITYDHIKHLTNLKTLYCKSLSDYPESIEILVENYDLNNNRFHKINLNKLPNLRKLKN